MNTVTGVSCLYKVCSKVKCAPMLSVCARLHRITLSDTEFQELSFDGDGCVYYHDMKMYRTCRTNYKA